MASAAGTVGTAGTAPVLEPGPNGVEERTGCSGEAGEQRCTVEVRLLASTAAALAAQGTRPGAGTDHGLDSAAATAFGRGLSLLSGNEPVPATGDPELDEALLALVETDASITLNGWRVLDRRRRYQALSVVADRDEAEFRRLRALLRPEIEEAPMVNQVSSIRRIFGPPTVAPDQARGDAMGPPRTASPSSGALFERLVEGECEQAVRFVVRAAEARKGNTLALDCGWIEEADGGNWPLGLVAWGLAARRREGDVVHPTSQDQASAAQALNTLQWTRSRLDTRAAALRFAAFELARVTKLLEIRESGFAAEIRGMRRLLEKGAGRDTGTQLDLEETACSQRT